MKRYRVLFAVVLLWWTDASAQVADSTSNVLKAYCANLPFSMPEMRVPAFPDHVVNILEHGAVADGQTMNTGAFAGAIQACANEGGGTVIVPPGTWLTGPIKLESNINLHLERGALVQFSKHISDFPFIAGFDGKSKRFVITPPIYAYRSHNLAITGEGMIDGAGEVWRYVKKDKLTARQWKDLTASDGVVSPDGEEWWPSQRAMAGEAYLKELEKSNRAITPAEYASTREYLRPDLVRLAQCTGILLDGPTFQNSPRFHVHLVQCENIVVRNVKIFTEWYAQNGDGLDLSSCRNVIVYNSTLSVGDDGLCVKPATLAAFQTPGPACENIVIADCVVYRAHGGFVVGSESYGGARNISVRNCVFVGTDVGIRFKSARGRGGLVENIFIEGIQMREIANEAILFDMYYGGGAPEVEAAKDRDTRHAEPVNDRTPRFQNISVKDVVCNGAQRAVLMSGLPEMPIRNILLEHLRISSTKGMLCVNADSIIARRLTIEPAKGPVIEVRQGQHITVSDATVPAGTGVFLKVEGEQSGDIHLVNVDLSRAKKGIELGREVPHGAVSSR